MRAPTMPSATPTAAEEETYYYSSGGAYYYSSGGSCYYSAVYYYSIQWDASNLSWADFRANILGATDPDSADSGSMRLLARLDLRPRKPSCNVAPAQACSLFGHRE